LSLSIHSKPLKIAKFSVKIITAAIDLYFKGVSLRKAADHLKQLYNFEVAPRQV